MDIRKMGTVMQISELDFDAAEEVDGYAQKLIEEVLSYLPKSKHKLVSRLLNEGIRQQYIVRNFNNRGDVSPKTGKPLSLIAPSPHLGYSTKAEADNRNKTQVRAAAASRGKRKKSTKTVEEMKEEFTPEVIQETAERLIEGNSKLSDKMDELNITFGSKYNEGTGSYATRRGRLDKDIDDIIEAIEADESYSQEELRKISQFISKLHTDGDPSNDDSWQPYVSEIHKERLTDIFLMASKKVEKAIWKGILKRSKIIELIDDFLAKLNGDTFEKGASNKVKRAIQRAVDNTEDYQYLRYDPNKGGKHPFIEFTEKNPEDRHEGKEPHKLGIPGTPANLQNYTKRIPSKLKEKVYADVSGNYSNQRPLNWEDYIKPRK